MLVAAIGPGAVLPAAAGSADDEVEVELRYRAFLAGTPVGEATVLVAVAGDRYQVRGDARSDGWLEGFTRWRNRFSASGLLSATTKQPAEFSYTETDLDKHRHLVVRDGVLEVTKNGRKRPVRQAPAGSDVVSALFVQPRCGDRQVLHTGRHVYRLKRLDPEHGECRYRVVDDDDDKFEVDVVLVRRDSLMVPGRIAVHGWVTGRVELVASEVR